MVVDINQRETVSQDRRIFRLSAIMIGHTGDGSNRVGCSVVQLNDPLCRKCSGVQSPLHPLTPRVSPGPFQRPSAAADGVPRADCSLRVAGFNADSYPYCPSRRQPKAEDMPSAAACSIAGPGKIRFPTTCSGSRPILLKTLWFPCSAMPPE